MRGARKQTAIDAIVVRRVLEPDVLDPISAAPALRGRVLPAVLLAIVFQQVGGVGLSEKLGGTLGLDRSTWQHRDGRCAVVDALSENFREFLFVLAFQQCSKVLEAFGVRRSGWLEAGAAQLTGARKMNAIRGKAVPEQRHAHALSCLVVIEHGE